MTSRVSKAFVCLTSVQMIIKLLSNDTILNWKPTRAGQWNSSPIIKASHLVVADFFIHISFQETVCLIRDSFALPDVFVGLETHSGGLTGCLYHPIQNML